MAAKLADRNTNVHVLKPRKARGSKSTGGRKPAAVSKPKPGQSRPAAKKTPAQPSDEDVRRNRQDRMLAVHHQLKATENKIVIASEALSDLRTVKKQQRAALANIYPLELYDDARKDADRRTAKVDLAQREKTRAEIRDAFGLPAGPQAELDLGKTPEAARPALHWYDAGFRDCMDGKFADPTAAGAPPENLQDYMRGHADGTARIGQGMKGLKADAALKPAAPPLMVGEDPAKAAAKQALKDGAVADAVAEGAVTADDVIEAVEEVIAEGANAQIGGEPELNDGRSHSLPEGEADGLVVATTQPDWTDFDNDPDKWNALQQNVFLTWFAGLGDEEVDIVHPGAQLMFDRCVEADGAERVDPTPLSDELGAEVHAGPAPAGIVYMLSSDEPYASGRQATYRDGLPVDAEIPGPDYPIYDAHPDAFEMSEAERQAQAPRRAIQERREADPQFSDD